MTIFAKQCIQENVWRVQSQEEYAECYNGYVARYNAAKAELNALQKEKAQRLTESDAIGRFMFEFSGYTKSIIEFNKGLWLAVVKKATVCHDVRLVFTFQNGVSING